MSEKGFFAALFDFSFTDFIALKLIKLLYILALVGVGLVALTVLIRGFSEGIGSGILGLILAPIVFIIGAIAARVYMELIIVLFRIAENTHRTVELLAARKEDTGQH